MLKLVFERALSQASSGQMDCLATHEDWRRQGKSVSNFFAHSYFSATRRLIILCVGGFVSVSTSTCLKLEAGREHGYFIEILVILANSLRPTSRMSKLPCQDTVKPHAAFCRIELIYVACECLESTPGLQSHRQNRHSEGLSVTDT